MWIIIRKSDNAVIGTITVKPPEEAYGKDNIVKEWFGPEPPIHNLDEGVESYDPTIGLPGYEDDVQCRQDFDDLVEAATTEIDWLNIAIPQIATSDLPELRTVIERLARQNRATLRAWKYILKRLA